jgi:predicted ATPase/DNA-binding SARP family transcriptional activator
MLDVDYSILGPLAVRTAPGAAPLPLGEKLQLLLGRMLLDPGTTFSADALAAEIWGDDKELANARNTVQAAVKQLRQRLGDTGTVRHAIVSDGPSYRLRIDDPLLIDAERFKRLAGRGHALATTHPRAARAMLDEALACWRGRLLGHHADLHWAAAHAVELDSMRAATEADFNDVRLRLGEHAEMEASLRRQIAERPADEQRRAQLVRALAGAGRTAEAILAYRDAARDLGGVGPELRSLGDRIARGLPTEPSAVHAPRALGPGRSDTPLLCAALTAAPAERGAAGLGTLVLLVDRCGGIPHPLGERGMIATFEETDDAVRAARAIAGYRRLEPAVAVHRGPTTLVGDRLAGAAASRCQLLARAAHPGQVLVSEDARRTLRGAVALHDLGPQRLEDLLPDEPVHELARGDEEEPGAAPPDTLSSRPHNLPVQQTRFVGRSRELAELSRLIGGGRLVTLLGVGGCGKTRLALQLAARRVAAFADGAWFVELAELGEGDGVDAVANEVANQIAARPLPEEPMPSAVARHLSDRAALLILDNCEHVVAACADLVVRLREAAPDVCIVVTSRRALRIDGERVLEVPAMELEPSADPDHLPDAVELLLDRAGPLDEGGDDAEMVHDATRICRAFEGSPLAIELAAAHVSTRGLAGVAAEVESMVRGELGLDFFASDDPTRPPRQKTIAAAIRWSHELLDDAERSVLHRLAVFRGAFGLDAAQRVGDDGDLGPRAVADITRRLVDRSVLAVDPPLEGAPRLRLSQPIRAFADDRLDAAERERAADRHAATYLALAIELAPALFDEREPSALERLEADHDNLRAALGRLIDGGRSAEALRMVGALWWMWFSHGHFKEGGRWVDAALGLDPTASRERVRALRAASHLAWWRGAYAATDRYNHALEACAEEIGDAWGLAWAPMGFGAVQMFAEPAPALLRVEESRRRFEALDGHDWEAAYALQMIGAAHWFSGDERSAGRAYEEAAEIFERLGHGSVLASVRRGAGLMAARCGQPGRGEAMCLDALRISTAIGDRAGSAQALNFLAAISRDQRDLDVALGRFGEALGHARSTGELWATCTALDGIAAVAAARGDADLAARLMACSQRLADRAGYRQSAYEQELRAAEVTKLMRTLDHADYERATAEGQLMSVGDATTRAHAFVARR